MTQDNKSSDDYTTSGKAIAYVLISALMIVLELLAIFAAYESMAILRPGDMLRAYAAPVLFNIALWAYVFEFVFLCGNNWQRVFSGIGAIMSLVSTVYVGALLLEITSTVGRDALYLSIRKQELLTAFEIAIAFHTTMHVLLILSSNFVQEQIAKQARLIKLAWRVRANADRKIASDIDELSDIESDDVQADFRAAHGWTKRSGNAKQSEQAQSATPRKVARVRRSAQASDKPSSAQDAETKGWQSAQPDAIQELPK